MTSPKDLLQFLPKSISMSFKQLAKSKNNTLQIYATPERYDMYKRTMAVTSQLYSHDLHFYNDSIEQRHQRNKQQIKKLISLLQNNQIIPEMLQYNTTNTFYPSYVLNHHYSQFYKFTTRLSQSSQSLRSLLTNFQNFTTIGAIFDQTISLQFHKQTKPALQNGLIKMNQNTYFYSFKTSPYIHICCFEIKKQNKNLFVFVQLRNQNGDIMDGIQLRDMGATLSNDYTMIGYRFNNVQPLFVVEGNATLYKTILSEDAVTELSYSLDDLSHSLYVTVRYTAMRTQFATLQKSKKQRPILQYQAVSSRIADGFATLFALSFLRQRLIIMPQLSLFIRFYLPLIHQVILQRLIDLRQCCGGYGFMQFSGHPAYMQRVSLRASQSTFTTIPDNKQIMKRLHYYSSDLDRGPAYIKQISTQGNNPQDIFIYFILICMGMKQNKNQMTSTQYMKEFLKQAGIQMMYSTTYFDPVDPSNPSEGILSYIIIKYVNNFFKFINPSSLKFQPEKLHELLINKQTQLLEQISAKIPQLTQILEVGFLRNVILGQTNQNSFYEKLMEASEKNKRNSAQYSNHILRPLVALIKEQRAKL